MRGECKTHREDHGGRRKEEKPPREERASLHLLSKSEEVSYGTTGRPHMSTNKGQTKVHTKPDEASVRSQVTTCGEFTLRFRNEKTQ